MKRILIGLIVAAVLAAGGWFGFNLYVRHRVTAEIEAAFEQVRSGGGKASHGKIGFDLPSRTLTIEDIDVEPGRPPLAGVKAASFKAVGVRQIDEAHIAADNVEIEGAELAIDGAAGAASMKLTYKIPRIALTGYSGPARMQGAPASDSIIDAYRFGLEQFAAMTAGSLSIPTITAAMTGITGGGTGDITYSGLTFRNIDHGKIETAKVERALVTINVQQPRPDKVTSGFSDATIDDFDANVVIAALNPEKTDDDSYRRVYRRISTAYDMTSTAGIGAKIGRILVEDIAYRPSKFRPAELLAVLPKDPSASQNPARMRELMEKLANIYEGARVGKVTLTDLSMNTPQGTGKLNAVTYSEGDFALEGLDAPAPQGQFKMERFALKSFSVTNLIRWAADLTKNAGRPPSPDQMLGLFGVLAGAEIKGVVAPFKNTKKLVTIDTMSLDWGQLVGSIPSKAHVVAKFVTPTDPSDPKQLPLMASGIDKLAIDLDLGAEWREASNSLALAPATLDIGGIARAQLGITLGNVPREVFSTDPAQLMGQAARIEAGSLAFSLRDNGGVEAAATQYARSKNVSRDAARQALADNVRAHREDIAADNPEAGAAVDAIAGFIETPGQTLVIKLTPRAKAPLMQIMQLLQTDPGNALAQFKIEASTGL
ncbi:hypothetical protein EAS56_33855 [Bradyrhizobium guangzhouense]|uniref:DUF748 domain-containing protein n=1 Tax=Bradyrhizobium guangzhouense TaxID=1325095 RepID=A0ABY0DYY8_9BRAD|nr:hypothetical protein [Bradyrhizobium guangzhouense]RXH06837.1 hypothetical protein EAS56_33855 [Bradyrhizobium guangzhouense]